ncbi:hypothetical protein JTE90_016637 [Oedothorax gibbosus]|uniref:DH domain-containing protein n=1 Tax=Oedothorax gibbosus TaxID=931172 RepID=A0AAV6U480_9ARAC|nr:hypothetical protein JTE90_016637 [Oedothorax gibbosus]
MSSLDGTGKRRKMEGFRHQGRPVYVRPTPETYAYQNLYGTVRTNPNGKARPSLDLLDHPGSNKTAKKSFNFLPWRKNKNNRADEHPPIANGTLSKHNKYKFGSVSALSSGGLYRDFDDNMSLSYTPSYSSVDLKHASVKSVGAKVRGGLVTYPWETYSSNGVDVKNSKNTHMINSDVGTIVQKTRELSVSDAPRPLCKCQKKKSGPFGTLNLNSLKASKCSCGFSSVRSTRGFAPPPPPPRRKSILPEKVDLYAVHEDQVQVADSQFGGYRRKHENIYDTLSRHGKYRNAPSPPSTKQPKFIQSIEKNPYSSVASRKSILECDVTAYDLVKNYLKADSHSIESDIDDDLSDNIIEGGKSAAQDLKTNDGIGNKSYKQSLDKSPSPVSSESESGIYSQASSVRIGGHGMKLFHPLDGNNSPQLYSEGSKTNSVDSRTSSWSNSSLSDDGIYSLPEPDYDDAVVQDTDSVLTYSDGMSSSSSLRKYASGGYLDSPMSSRDSQVVHYETPRFSTIRKATSMMSLVGSEGGTLRGRPKVPSVPEIPSSSSNSTNSAAPIPPPPPPPPPPPNFSIKSTTTTTPDSLPNQTNNNTLTKKQQLPTNNVASSIASELSEKLKSNRPILKKKEIVPKQPISVNSHNPYAEVKSILKKTSTDKSLTTSPSSAESSGSPNKEVLDLLVKKKRVQFKSLSNESLLSNPQKSRTLSSSSDEEEWEEARENFNEDPKKDSKSESKVKNANEDSPRSENGLAKNNNDTKVPTKPSTIPRPSQPPPPPPINRNLSTNKVTPPPRPLGTAPKSFSQTDLRSTDRPMPDLLRIRAVGRQTGTTVRGRRATVGFTNTAVFESSNKAKPENSSNLPKNGESSPAASLEADTSPRGKSDDQPIDVATRINQFNLKFSKSTTDGDTTRAPLELSKSPKDGDTTADDSSSESSYMSLLCDKNLNCLHEKSPDSRIDIETVQNDETKCNSVCETVTCTVVSNEDKSDIQESTSELEVGDNNFLLGKYSNTSDDDKLRLQEAELQQKPADWSSCESLSLIEGPLYSNLLYVPLPSPTPPPLPISAPPPLPPKRSPHTRLSSSDSDVNRINTNVGNNGVVNAGVSVSDVYANVSVNCDISASDGSDFDDVLYDVLPSKPSKKADVSSIYESRRYSNTCATVVTISSGADEFATPEQHVYCTLGGSDGVYEEVGDADSKKILASPNPFGRHRRSFFEGASKAEILRFLEVAKERVVGHIGDDDSIMGDEEDDVHTATKNVRNTRIRISNISSSSDSSTVSSASSERTLFKPKVPGGSAEIERADSGVGSETSSAKPLRRAPLPPAEELCADCDQQLETKKVGGCCPLVCGKCDKKRSERKEIVTEIVETEFKYGKDLLVIKEEFKVPMEVAGLLSKEQLSGIFINLDELMLVNAQFAEKLKDATDIAQEQGDEDFTTVNIGKLFLETTTMLRAFEVYCIRQGSASLLLTQLEKERELLRIFLRVSQMENTLLRRMNLAAFLMVPVQRVTKYPLLLSRLYKVTPYHHKDREALREAQLKIELHLEHINQQTKGVSGTKIWRRISNISAAHRRNNNSNVSDIGSIQLRKMALEVLEWSKEDIRFVLAGKLSFSGGGQLDFVARSIRGKGALKFSPSHALLATKGRPNGQYRPDLVTDVMFPRNTGIQDAALMLVKEKNGRYSLARDPLFLGTCIISAELEDEDIIEIQEYTTKESIFLKAECRSDTLEWLKQLRYHAKDLGTWKRRRNALANIMINGMIRQQ